MTDRAHGVVEFVHEGLRGGDVEPHDIVVTHVVDVFDEGSERIAVRGDENALAGFNRGFDHLFPIGDDAGHRILEAFRRGNVHGGHVRVTGVVQSTAFVAFGERIRGRRVGAAPDQNLSLAEFLRGFRFVEALQSAVVAFVQAPGVLNRDPHLVKFVQGDPERTHGTL